MSAARRRALGWSTELDPYYERVEGSGMTMLRTARLGGYQTLAATLFMLAVLPLVPPTEAFGDAGWALAAGFFAVALAAVVFLLRTPALSPELHLALIYVAVAAVSLLTWLAGGVDAPYVLFFGLTAQHVAVHPTRRAVPLMALMVASVVLPVAYAAPDATTAALIVGLSPTLLALAATVRYAITGLYTDSVAREVAEATGRSEAEVARREAESARSAARRLRELDQMKEGFVSTVSHELRSPLTAVKGYLEAMLEGEVGELTAEQREYAEIVYRNSSRLQSLVDDLLALARMEAGKLSLERDRFDLVAAVREICDEIGAGAREPVPALEIEAPEELEIAADRRRLEQAIANLVSNAIKFGTGAPDGPAAGGAQVRVRVIIEGADAVVEVIDHGVGIPAAELEWVGERFFRASTAGTRPGSGLGLAITREIVQQHGGALEVSSTEGAGSTFRARWPLSGRP